MGNSVASSACEIGRHPKSYGADAEEFRPERRLEVNEEPLRMWETLDVKWGFDVRKCLGKYASY